MRRRQSQTLAVVRPDAPDAPSCGGCRAEKMQAVARLAGEVAHDVNNILMAIEAARDDVPPSPANDVIAQATARGADLARRLLGLSHHQEVTAEVLDLESVLRQLLPTIRDQAGEGVDVVLEAAAMAPLVRLCPAGLHRAMLALTGWARDAVRGSGRMTLHLDAGEGHVSLTVEHGGAPLDEAEARSLFDPFAGPHGMELTFVHALATRAGGHVEASVGSRELRVVFPAAEVVARRSWEPTGATGQEVLIVDDELLVRKSLARVLRRAGYTVHEAGDAPRALALAREHGDAIGVMLLDVRMPDASGPELAEAIAAEGVLAPVIFMSGYVPDDVDARRIGASDYIQKPFAIDELMGRLHVLLGDVLDIAQEA